MADFFSNAQLALGRWANGAVFRHNLNKIVIFSAFNDDIMLLYMKLAQGASMTDRINRPRREVLKDIAVIGSTGAIISAVAGGAAKALYDRLPTDTTPEASPLPIPGSYIHNGDLEKQVLPKPPLLRQASGMPDADSVAPQEIGRRNFVAALFDATPKTSPKTRG